VSELRFQVGDLVEVMPSKQVEGEPVLLAIATGCGKRGWVTVEFVSDKVRRPFAAATPTWQLAYPFGKLRLISRG
jgi:hypothetical protein